ncbi:MAG: hypothetical protein ACREKS_00655 [Candidatus Rokuibacteriota bacterium]
MTTRNWFLWVAATLAVALCSGSAAGRGRPEPATVPLTIVALDGGGFKIGIALRLGGGPPQLYTFDTGSSGFYAAYNPLWWPFFEPVPGPTIDQHYGSGETFQAERVRTTVGIPTNLGEIEAEVEIAEITDAWGGALGPPGKSTWLDDVAAGRPPLYGHFFGDFGSGLVEKNGLFAVLPQLPGNLSSGFAVQTGCGPSEPTLALGLTRAIRSRVTSGVPMQGAGQSPPFPHSHRPTYAQELPAAEFLLRRGRITYAFLADAILDTGAPTTNIHEHGDLAIPACSSTRRTPRARSALVSCSASPPRAPRWTAASSSRSAPDASRASTRSTSRDTARKPPSTWD